MPEDPVLLDRLARRVERLGRIRALTEDHLDRVLAGQLGGRPESHDQPSSEGSVLIPVGLVALGLAAALALLVVGAPPPSALAAILVAVVAALLLHRRLTRGANAAAPSQPTSRSQVAIAARAAAGAHERALRDWRAAWVRSSSEPERTPQRPSRSV